MGDTGLEPVDVKACREEDLQNRAFGGGARSGAQSGDLPKTDADLQCLIDAWPDLSDHIKAAVLALVRAAEEVDS